ncbi:CehA/McbA family metallohydrolase [Photobacterium satsumensis]|uniref:CehA/McbA family metallohydrolase n=1 Tax=Photobacterium satsumensis TaxID=2910239 RepID=UPI003D14E02E
MLTFSGELAFGHRVERFEVPAGIQTLSITGTTVKQGFLYAYLYDAKQQLRAAILWVKPEKQIVISRDAASLGGIAGDIPSGEWELHLYNLEGENRNHKPMQYQANIAFEVAIEEGNQQIAVPAITVPTMASLNADNQITFDYTKIKSPESRWYRGDLHAHTVLSDGHNTLEAATEIIECQQLDFMFLTEHNICHPRLPDSSRTLILPGVEVTTDKGHFNVHGPRSGLAMSNADYSSEALIRQGVAKLGGNISINHPMMKPWHWHYNDMPLAHVDTMELCCDPTWSTSPASTESALNVLTAMWNNGHRIYAVGGSDSHLEPHERNPKATEPSIYGDPSTFVFSHGLSGEGILAGLRQGHVYLERCCGLAVSINHGSVLPGQDVGEGELTYHLSVRDRSQAYFAECVADGEVIERFQLSPEGRAFTVGMQQRKWLRIDIRRGDLANMAGGDTGEFEGVINPVFNGQHAVFSQPLVTTWGELMETMKNNGN